MQADAEQDPALRHGAGFLGDELPLQRRRAMQASRGLTKTAMNPSPVFFTTSPRCETIAGSMTVTRNVRRWACVSDSAASISRV